MQIYCGNNRYELVGGTKRLGTPYECLKQGVGVGLHASLENYNPQYEPIVPNTTYCGSAARVPAGKTLGTLSQCLVKGIGIGKKLQYERSGGGGGGGRPPPQEEEEEETIRDIDATIPIIPNTGTDTNNDDASTTAEPRWWLYLFLFTLSVIAAVLLKQWWVIVVGVLSVLVVFFLDYILGVYLQ